MTEAPFLRVKEVLAAVRDRPVAERAAHLDRLCGTDAALRREVESLLDVAGRRPDFLGRPAAAVGDAVDAALAPDREPRGRSDDVLLPAQVGRYRVLRLLGVGGMGAVYEAEQDSPRRRVALKMIAPGLATPQALQRFRREAELLGRLRHPGIAQIHEAGSVDLGAGEQPFFAMELVDGRPITRHAEQQRLDTRGRLELFVAVCDAVHHAHVQGVIHRDLKPDNVLVTEAGASTVIAPDSAVRRPVGQPKVLDFGVGRATDGELAAATLRTTTGQLVGTLPYMSPEQVAGGTVDERSDVYALGVLLYELLTGRLPHGLAGRSVPEAARIIREDEPTRLASVDTRYRGDLDTIVLKTLEKDPARRYASAAELGADALRHLHDEPITARPASTLYQLRKFTRRHRALVIGTALALVALASGLAVSIRFGLGEAEQRELAETRERDARFASYQAGLAAARAADDPVIALAALDATPEEFRGWEEGFLRASVDPVVIDHHLDPDGDSRLAGAVGFLAGRPVAWRLVGDELQLVDLDAGAVLERVPDRADVECLALGADGSTLAAAPRGPGTLEVWSLTEAGLQPRWQRAVDGCRSLALDPTGRHLARHEPDRGVIVADLDTGAERHWFHEPGRITSLAFDASGTRLTVGGPRGTGLWVVTADDTGERLTHLGRAASLAPDASWVASSGETGLRVHRLDGSGARFDLGTYIDIPNATVPSPDGALLASAAQARVLVWDVAERRRLAAFAMPGVPPGHGQALAFGAGGGTLLAITNDGQTRGWQVDARSGTRLDSSAKFLYEAVFSPDGSLIALGGDRRRVELWDALSARRLAVLPHEEKRVRGLAFSADGTQLVLKAGTGLVLWDTAVGAASRRDQPWSPMADAPGSGEAPAATGRAQREARDHGFLRCAGPGARITHWSGERQAVVLGPEGRVVVRGVTGGFERVSLASGEPLSGSAAAFDDTEHPAVAVSPDGALVATGHGDGSIVLWDGHSGARRHVLRGHAATVYSLDVSPDGTRLASGSRDGTLRVWHVERAALLLTLHGHDDYVHAVRFSPDGHTLLTGSGDGSARLWGRRAPLERRRAVARDAARAAVLRPRVLALLQSLGSGAAAAVALRADGSLDPDERGTALRVLLEALSEG